MKNDAPMARFIIFLIIKCCCFLSMPCNVIHHFQECRAFVIIIVIRRIIIIIKLGIYVDWKLK